MLETRHPIGITTKSDRVCDDLDLLAKLAELGLTAVAISVTSLEPRTAKLLEPRAPAPYKRLAAVKMLREAAIPAHVNIAPVIPAITDHEIEAIAEAAAEHKALSISTIPVRLPHEVAPLFIAWLEAHFPDRKDKVMHIIQSIRGGRNNDPSFFDRFRGQGPWAELIRTRTAIARKRYGLENAKFGLRCDLFVPPEVNGQMRFML